MAKAWHVGWLLEGVEAWNRRRQDEPFEPDLADVNLYDVFEKCGALAADGFVPLGGVDLRYADLHRTIFQKPNRADATSIAEYGADLRGANLNMANLEMAELAKARLDGADLTEAVLSYATVHDADLREANLSGALLSKADLAHSNLTRASLSGAVITDAMVWDTELYGVNFSGSEPWKANFHSSPGLESTATLSSAESVLGTARSVASLLDSISELKRRYERELSKWPAASRVPALEQPRLYFRGHANMSWELKPYAMRHEGTKENEGRILNELMLRRPEDFNEFGAALSWWVLAQHHGLPTRFLDLSRNPLVALFHACGPGDGENGDGTVHVIGVVPSLIERFDSDRASIVANFARMERSKQLALLGFRDDGRARPVSRGYQAAMRELCDMVRREKPQFGDYVDIRDLLSVFVIEPQQILERLRAQSGAFLASAFHERFERGEVLGDEGAHGVLGIGRGTPVHASYQISIPADAKVGILNELEMLDVTREKLFPGLDSAAERIRGRFIGVGDGTEDTDVGNRL